MNSIQVCCRFRPMNALEESCNGQCCISITNGATVMVLDCEAEGEAIMSCAFDHVFDEQSNQEDVYELTSEALVLDALEGYNCTIFAYGQTGAGKSHTIVGNLLEGAEDERGIIPRAAETLFEQIDSRSRASGYDVRVSFLEIYMERIQDLLKLESSNLKVRQAIDGGILIEGLTEVTVQSKNDIFDLLTRGNSVKATASTRMNKESSRSHTVLIIYVIQRNISALVETRGKLFIVDLAGSELATKTMATGRVFDESKGINKSLSALGNVIKALVDGKKHIPYRDSKLTRILQDSLGGNSKTCLIVNASKSSYNLTETVSTLRFGIRSKEIKNKAQRNEETSPESYRGLIAMAHRKIATQMKEIQILSGELSSIRALFRRANEIFFQANIKVESQTQCNRRIAAAEGKPDEKHREIRTAAQENNTIVSSVQHSIGTSPCTSSGSSHSCPPKECNIAYTSNFNVHTDTTNLYENQVRFEEKLRRSKDDLTLNSEEIVNVETNSALTKEAGPFVKPPHSQLRENADLKLKILASKVAIFRQQSTISAYEKECENLKSQIRNRDSHIENLSHLVLEFQQVFKTHHINKEDSLKKLNIDPKSAPFDARRKSTEIGQMVKNQCSGSDEIRSAISRLRMKGISDRSIDTPTQKSDASSVPAWAQYSITAKSKYLGGIPVLEDNLPLPRDIPSSPIARFFRKASLVFGDTQVVKR